MQCLLNGPMFYCTLPGTGENQRTNPVTDVKKFRLYSHPKLPLGYTLNETFKHFALV